jgi:hypothetical protein
VNSFLEKSSKFNQNFDTLIQEIDFSRRDIYENCRIIGNNKITELELSDILKVLDFLNIDIGELGKGNICSATVRAQMAGSTYYMKDSYIGNKGTRLKSIESALSVLTPMRKSHILKKYQLKKEVLEQGDRLVSAELIRDIFDDISVYSFTNQVDIVGHVNCKKFLSSSLSKDLRTFDKPMDAYVHMIESCTELVEKNMDYTILKMEPTRLIFKYETKVKVQEFFGVKHFGSIKFCQNIKGFFEGLVKNNYGYLATVNKLSCAHFGNTSCTYEIIFDDIVTH